ncbi:MAG TPA: hypothetical protein VGX28_14810 [Frankiaceae bacterium]|nr:hypothetical protein [Frankiaceae bacterium]
MRAQLGDHLPPVQRAPAAASQAEYPTFGGDAPDDVEVEVATAQALVDAAAALLPGLSAF